MKLTIPTPLDGLQSPYSQEHEKLLQQLGHVLGFFMEAKVQNGQQALMLLHLLRNAAAAQQNLETAFLCDHLAIGMLESIPKPNKKVGVDLVKKSKPGAKVVRRLKKLRLVE